MKLKLIAITLISAAIIALSVSCGETTYKNDISVADLKSSVEAKLANTDTFTDLDSDYIEYMMEIEASAYTEAIVRWQASGISADEYGIFKAESTEKAEKLGNLLKNYLAKRVDTWNPSYDAAERPKIDNAEVKVMGNYAVFCILSESDRTAVFTAVESELLGK